MPPEPLRVDTDLLTGSVFAPYMDYLRELIESTRSDITALGPLVPRRTSEIDDHVIELEEKNIPLVFDLLIATRDLPTGDADSADFLAKLLEGLEDHNTKEAGPNSHNGPIV
ncbi:MAG: hypothetical protein ACRDT8_11565 [Micromonosporaceae bacterium]